MGQRRRFRVGDLVAITFRDHVEDGDAPILFRVYGELAAITKTHYCVDSWAYVDRQAPHDGNEKRFTIIKSAVNSMSQLVPVGELM